MERRIAIDSFHPHELEFLAFGTEGPGPRVLITAGIHGGEATGIWAARELAAWLRTQEVRGHVSVLPVANPAAFRKLSRHSPYDELDLNRIFPGAPEGTPSMVVASTIWEQALKSDYVIDLHCCGIFGSDYTLALWREFPAVRDLAGMIDIPVVIESGGTRQQLFVDACHAGIPSVIIELAGGQFGESGGILNRASGERAVTAVANLLRRLGVVPGQAPDMAPAFFGKLKELTALRPALWSPAVTPGARVTADQPLGSLDGDPVRSPFNGVVPSVRAESYVFPGHTVANVAPEG